jgi:YihY family inner membrane protein
VSAPTADAADDTTDATPDWVARLVGRLEAFQASRPWVAVPFATSKKFGEDRAGNLAGLIAYYGFFSLFPLLLVLVTLVGFVLRGDEQLQQDILDSALAQFPVIGDQLRENTGQLDASGFALVAGSLSALWAGTGVMKAAQDAMNDVWDVPMVQRPNFFLTVGRAFGMLVVLGGGVLLTAAMTGVVGAALGGSGTLARLLALVLCAALNVGVFVVGFRVLTVRDVTVRQLLPGALLAGLAWMALQLLGGFLLDTQVNKASNTYGAFAVVIGLLWWIYLQAQVMLFAAELNVVLANRLWPRSLTGHDRPTDRRTLRQHAAVEERAAEEEVEVRFTDPAG